MGKPVTIKVEFRGGVWDGADRWTTEKKATKEFRIGRPGGVDVYHRHDHIYNYVRTEKLK